MNGQEDQARQTAQQQYDAAIQGIQQPVWPADRAPADPYGRTLTLSDGDLVVTRGAEGQLDLTFIVGKPELAQGILVLVGTPLGSDIFNTIFGLDLLNTLAQPKPTVQMRELIRLCVVKAIAQEPRVRQIRALAFADEPAYLTIHPEITPQQQLAIARQQKSTRHWMLDALLDTSFGDQLAAGLQGVGL